MTKRVQAHVTGHVQGVGFRYYAVHVAQELGLAGAVRNTADSGVEAIAEGEEPQLQEFIEALRHGPHTAHVTGFTTAWGDPTGEFSDFIVVA